MIREWLLDKSSMSTFARPRAGFVARARLPLPCRSDS